ncbi:MAG: glycosyltransferase [Planctomycetes bacterium]|nr:glycosyltransferase [Planctomycetota bacterium]
MSERLLVITEELPGELHAAGADASSKAAYYNPADTFESVALIDWGRDSVWPGLPHRVLRLPPDAALHAWLAAVQAADFNAVMGEELIAGWPGVPAAWLASIREFAPTCVRAYGARWSGWLGLEVARELNVPVLCSLHNVIGLASPVLKQAPLLMAVSDEVARAAIEAGADPARVVTVLNRVNRDRFTPEGEVAAGPQGSPKLLSVARDVEQKNLDRLLDACELAREKHPDLRLVHIGRSDRDWTKYQFVTHIGMVPNHEMPTWMRWADALVLPSLWEGFCVTLIESLSCGTPVITSNRPSMNEAVTDRWDGLLCDPESVTDIARAIHEISDEGTRARLAAPARTSSEPYGFEAISRRERALYEWMLQATKPKVSVVMPTFNRRQFIEKAVRNVLDQEYPELELVVVDDGSTDDTPTILNGFVADPRVKLITQENQGLSRAVNRGMAEATGHLLMWKGDDDYFADGAIEALARELAIDPEAGLVFADYVAEDSSGKRVHVHTGPIHELAQRNVVGLCFLFRRSVWLAVGSVNPDFHLAEDYELWVRMSQRAKLKRLVRTLYTVTQHAGTLTQSKFAQVQEMTLRVQAAHFGPPRDADAYAAQLARLAGAYKTQGMPFRSLGAAMRLFRSRPGAGAWAALRALMPGPLLRLSRRIRGLQSP